MVDKISTPKTKRLPKGQRAHVRRLKAEARRTDTVYRNLTVISSH